MVPVAEQNEREMARLRAWWAHRQGLDGSLGGRSAEEVLSAAGWTRSVGGSSPYLALFSRAGLRREEVDRALAAGEIRELPSARGCTYVLPRSDYALGLAAGRNFSAQRELKTALGLGVTLEEITALRAAVLDALRGGALDSEGLKRAVGDAARSLGPEGVRKGLSNTLSVALGLQEQAGEVRRIPVNGRLDQQRYRYALWVPNPLAGFPPDPSAAFAELARRYFSWTGPASMAEFQWFSGLGAKAAKAAAEPLGLVPAGDRLILPADLPAFEAFRLPSAPQYSLVSSLDSITQLRRDFPSLLAPEDRDRAFNSAGKAVDLPGHAILDRGRVAGFWEYDPGRQAIVWMTFGKPDQALSDVVARTEAFVREDLGDVRGNSLDSPKSREPKIAALREATGA